MKNNFGHLPKEFSNFSNSEIAVIPAIFEKKSSNYKGYDKSAELIIEKSKNIQLLDKEVSYAAYRHGIFTTPYISHSSSRQFSELLLSDSLSLLNQNKFIVTIGGDLTIALSTVKAHAIHYKKISVLHIGPKSSISKHKEEYNFLYNAIVSLMKNHKNIHSATSVGITESIDNEIDKINLFLNKDIKNDDMWMEKVIGSLYEKTYITIDFEIFNYHNLDIIFEFLKKLVSSKNIVGFDITEVNPNNESIEIAPNFIYKFINYIFSQKERKKDEYVQVHEKAF